MRGLAARVMKLCRQRQQLLLILAILSIAAVFFMSSVFKTVVPKKLGILSVTSDSGHRSEYHEEYVSKILIASNQRKEKSKTNYIANLRFGHTNLSDGKPLLLEPVPFQPERKPFSQIQEFLSRENLLLTPFDTDGLSPYLTTNHEVIDEAQRIHFNMFKHLFKGKKYALLFHMATHENKGDAAISVGELILFERMGVKLVFYLDSSQNSDRDYKRGLDVARQYPVDEVIVLMHGGGNIFGYGIVDIWREKVLNVFEQYTIALFPQSIYMSGNEPHFKRYQRLYRSNPRLTLMLRDRLSLQIAQRIFNNGTRLLLVPDMAFQVGNLTRYLPPYYDVSWQKRSDSEGPMYSTAPNSLFPHNLTLWTWDWLGIKSVPDKNSAMKAVNIMEKGLSILLKGRVLVTDRLHGHILSTLLNIPHVLLDNPDNKLSSYHNTWTRGLSNCRVATSTEQAARFALELLETYKDTLPKRITSVDLTINPPTK